tara:strand:- start:173 stop:751 length:579 start_codon:yes stop_codon:yes gene_type:complete
MKFHHLKDPFYHTIIENYFEDDELNKIILEIEGLDTSNMKTDTHHAELYERDRSEAYYIDGIYRENREESNIIKYTRNIFGIDWRKSFKNNPFLKFIPFSNYDIVYLQKYISGSSYSEHYDNSLLTCVYTIHAQEFEGGQLSFPDYRYVPDVKHNSCIIFPGCEKHEVKEVRSRNSNYVRYTLNQRVTMLCR